MKRLPVHAIDATGTPDASTVLHGDGTWASAGVLTADTLPDATAYPDELAVLRSVPMLGSDGLHPNDAGMTYLADQYQAALSAAGKTFPSGTHLYAYGDSWTAEDIMCSPGKRAVVQLANNLGITLENFAVSGWKLGDCAARAIGPGTGTWLPGVQGLALIAGAGLNDLRATDTTQQRAASKNYLRAMLTAICAAERIEQTAFTFSSGWGSTTNAGSTFSGGNNAYTTTDGASASYAITTPGTYYLLTQGTDGSAGMVGGTLTISQGGTTLATQDLNAQHVNTDNTLTAGFGPLAVRLDNVQVGTLTITFSTAGRAGAQGFVDALVRLSATPPTVLAVKPLRVLDPVYDKPALLDYIRSQYDAMATEFGTNVVVCDPAPNWSPDGGGAPGLWFSDGSVWQQPTASGSGGGSAAPSAAEVAFTPTGNLAATDAQGALVELDTEKVAASSLGQANGVATLGADGKVPSAQLPAASAGGITVQDENGTVATGVTQIDFQGAGITASSGTGEVVVTVPGGSAGAGALLAAKDYNPATGTTLGTTAVNTVQDVDATNLAVTFTAPDSGRVLVRLTAVVLNTVTPAYPHWFLREGTTVLTGRWLFRADHANQAEPGCVAFLVSGLTPGSSHTYKWAHATDNGATQILVGGPLTLSGNGPAVMEVWAA